MKIRSISARDIRFPTSLHGDGSDAQHHDPDYSCAYVVLFTDTEAKGYGLSFTIGRGTEIVVLTIKSLAHVVVGRELTEIVSDFGSFSRRLTNDSQLRWLGPEKGVVHLAASAIINAIWDLYARVEQKPVWKLLCDMPPKDIVRCIDFTYIEDALTKEEAVKILEDMAPGKADREDDMRLHGFPCYATSIGWMGYDDAKVESRLEMMLETGVSWFKFKVGRSVEEDKRRLTLVRKIIGPDRKLAIDANQVWGVDQAIEWVKELAEFSPVWIEEPTSCDDILGHAKVAEAVNPLGIGVATGEHCHNRVMFKQFLQAGAVQFCQIDACRLGGINETIAVMLMAKKFGVPVCPHAGGVGLCEMVQHLAIFNYIAVSGDREKSICEFADHLHEHFVSPPVVRHGSYMLPVNPGYSVEMIGESLLDYEYPHGPAWKELFQKSVYQDPKKVPPPYVDENPEAQVPAVYFQKFQSAI